MSSINLPNSFISLQSLARLTEEWNGLKSHVINNVGKPSLESENPSVESELGKIRQDYAELLAIFKTVENAHQHLNEVKEKGCTSFGSKLLGMSCADTASLCAGLGMALFTFYSEQEGKNGASNQESSALKIISIALIGFSQVIGKYKDYTSSANSKAQAEMQRSLTQISALLAQRDFLSKTKALIVTGERLLQTSRAIKSRELQQETVLQWNSKKVELFQALTKETLELEDTEDHVELSRRLSSLSLTQNE